MTLFNNYGFMTKIQVRKNKKNFTCYSIALLNRSYECTYKV